MAGRCCPSATRKARLLVVGLAPGMHGANRTGRPFTGDYAGILLYETLHRFGFASARCPNRPTTACNLIDCRITNAVKCLPPANKPETGEIKTCNRYLAAELRRSRRSQRVILALGWWRTRPCCMALGLKQSALARSATARAMNCRTGAS
jgi:uracil-DNA glycosylase family 4